jgi:CheY-like chemotaxis protein
MTSHQSILYAEDDANDVFLMERAFTKLNIPNPLRVVPDGKLAVAYLSGAAPYQNREEYPVPCLLLLDLSMPGLHGLEVLKWVKSESALAALPVVVLSSSNQESDIQRAYRLGASGFLIKPGAPAALIRIVRSIQEYWLAEQRPPGKFVDFAPAGNVPPPVLAPAEMGRNAQGFRS